MVSSSRAVYLAPVPSRISLARLQKGQPLQEKTTHALPAPPRGWAIVEGRAGEGTAAAATQAHGACLPTCDRSVDLGHGRGGVVLARSRHRRLHLALQQQPKMEGCEKLPARVARRRKAICRPPPPTAAAATHPPTWFRKSMIPARTTTAPRRGAAWAARRAACGRRADAGQGRPALSGCACTRTCIAL